MCKKWTVAYADCIGRNRLVGWCVAGDKDFQFLSDRQVKARIQIGEPVNGLMLDEDGKVVIDSSFATNLMCKSGLAFSPIMAQDEEYEEPIMNKYYALVKVTKSKEYHFITNRCGREVFTEEQLKAMLAILSMGGVRMDDKGNLMIHPAVEVEGATGGSNKATEDSKNSKKNEGTA